MSRVARDLRSQLRTIVLLAALMLLGITVGVYLVVHQRIVWPSWVPLLGQHEFVLNARVSSVAGVLPGQGQAVTISGVSVGQISGVSLSGGEANLRLEIDPQYANRIYPDATVLLRPKTGLNDMVAELDPGSPGAGPRLRSGATLGAGQTLPPVSLDEVLAQLDGDTRAELDLLVAGAGETLQGSGGSHLANVFRQLDPLSRDVKAASALVALRSIELRRLIGNLSKVANELGGREAQLTTFVRGNEGTFRALSDQDQNLQRTIALLPGALSATDGALKRATALGGSLRTTLGGLTPAARALAPTLRDLRPFFSDTTPVIRDRLRPFSVKAQPTVRLLVPATRQLAAATPKLTTLARELDNIVNELAYQPKDGQSYLFYLPWASHDTNSVLSTQDGVGPLRRSMILFSCGSLQLLQDLAKPTHNPTLATLVQLLSTPNFSSVCRGGLPR